MSRHTWDFGDGVAVSNRLHASHAWVGPGIYPVRLTGYNDSHPEGVSATVLVQVTAREVYYVNGANASPVPPYTDRAERRGRSRRRLTRGRRSGDWCW